MRVFVSYAREQQDVADRIAIGIRQAGDDVFFDKDALPPGEEYDAQIEKEIRASDLFLFLLSAESVAKGTYALAELAAARRRWPSPSGHVLPVEVAPVDRDHLPAYLSAVGILKPEGNLVAETLSAVARMRGQRRRRKVVIVGAAAAGLLAATAMTGVVWMRGRKVRTEGTVSMGSGTASIVSGKVLDATTGASISGVTVKVQAGSALLGEARTGSDGAFHAPFQADTKGARTFTLLIEHPDYAAQSQNFDTADARPSAHEVKLLPLALIHCQQSAPHAMLIGQFSGPDRPGSSKLSTAMAEAFTYSLLTVLQRHDIEMELQPHFSACWEANLRSPDLAGTLARALNADALVFGRIAPAQHRFDITTFVGDRYGLFPTPASFVNPNVDLDAPEAAQLDARTHAAVLGVVAASYAEAGKFADCVNATVAAEQAGGELSRELTALRVRCQKGSGTAVLLARGGP